MATTRLGSSAEQPLHSEVRAPATEAAVYARDRGSDGSRGLISLGSRAASPTSRIPIEEVTPQG